jgi:hypothetical protein
MIRMAARTAHDLGPHPAFTAGSTILRFFPPAGSVLICGHVYVSLARHFVKP